MRPTALISLLLCAATAGAQPVTKDAADWRKGAVCYEIFVRSFFDSDGDGIGDINGLTAKLDYINDGNPSTTSDLGARCIWLMPVMASPSYHGYDATDYYRIQHEFGTNDDFKRMVAEAHKRGIRVLIDMVLNHASNEHPYFKDAALHTSSPYRHWWRWSPTAPDIKGPWGQPVWHKSPVRDEYYYGIFWHGMPDLNYENPAVREEAKKVATFWLREMGVDGFRLDAIPYLVEDGSKLSGTPATHQFLREYSAHLKTVAPNSFTVGEVWDSVGAMLPYYPDQLDSHFAFELSEAILKAVKTGSSAGLYDGYLRLQRALPAERWSPFLRNHDQTRTMTEFKGDAARARLAVKLLLTLPGLPFIYYGEELGMTGDKPDPRLRTPMHWKVGPAAGFTTGVPWEPLQPDSLTANVEVLERNPGSILHLHRSLIHLRSANSALGAGQLVPLATSTPQVAAYLRRDGDHVALIIANLGTSRVASPAIWSDERVLESRRYEITPLLGAPPANAPRIQTDGRLARYVPLGTIGPLEANIYTLR
jgi:alpha-amylase